MIAINQTPPKQKMGLAIKLLARLCDPSCQRGAGKYSALKLVDVVSMNGISLRELAVALAEELQFDEPEPADPPAWSIVFDFGKYDGLTIGEVAIRNPEYVRWALENLTCKPVLQAALRRVAVYFGLIGGEEE